MMQNDQGLARLRTTIDAGPFDATPESLVSYQPPMWYEDGKFGIFIHWGVYSVPAFGSEWYPRDMYRRGTATFEHHTATYGAQAEFGYKDFIPSFTMHDFDPSGWSRLFRQAGAQFVVPVAEHHDGYSMHPTDRSRWNAAVTGPKRDVLGDLLAAADEASLVRGASSHRAEHWYYMNGGTGFDSDVLDPEVADLYGPAQREETAPQEAFLEDWLLRTAEIIDRYRPQVLWFDWWVARPPFRPFLHELTAYYYNRAHEWGRGVVLNYKGDALPAGAAVWDVERGSIDGIRPMVWQNDTSMSRTSWGWIEGHDYKSVDELIGELVDTVSKNGVLLLNVGPRADGTIPEREQELLRGIGAWLHVCGEGIYGTRPWVIPAEGPTKQKTGSFVDGTAPSWTGRDIRFTARHDEDGEYRYAILLRRPDDDVARVRAFGTAGPLEGRILAVEVLGDPERPEWSQKEDALVVRLRGGRGPSSGAVVKVTLAADRD